MNEIKVKIENARLINQFPFVAPRENGLLLSNYDFSWTFFNLTPAGWKNLLYNMFLDIKEELVKQGCLYKFEIYDIKEKYGNLIVSCNGVGGRTVDDIISKYEYMSGYVCSRCGKEAKYTTTGYFLPYCKECSKSHKKLHPICFSEIFFNMGRLNVVNYTVYESCKYEWNRVIGCKS